eukprot:760812-Hanusia_phi.AAC.5
MPCPAMPYHSMFRPFLPLLVSFLAPAPPLSPPNPHITIDPTLDFGHPTPGQEHDPTVGSTSEYPTLPGINLSTPTVVSASTKNS